MPEEKKQVEEVEEQTALPQVVDAHQVLDYKLNILISQDAEILDRLTKLEKKL